MMNSSNSVNSGSRAPRRRVINALTIDVEDYFQVSALEAHFPRERWETTPCRVEANVERILALLDESSTKATFFTLGWIAERYPAMVRRIVAQGHELASHGYFHRRATEMSQSDFAQDIGCAKKILEDIGGEHVQGYRAPSFSVSKRNLWVFDVLLEQGYRYSSSVYPVKHDHYGIPDAPRRPYASRTGLLEIPITTARLFEQNLPAGGGGYFRFLPYSMSSWLIRRVNEVEGQPSIFYFHPWEIDHQQPRVAGVSAKTRFRHYINLDRTESRLRSLFRDFSWDRMDRVYAGPLAEIAP